MYTHTYLKFGTCCILKWTVFEVNTNKHTLKLHNSHIHLTP